MAACRRKAIDPYLLLCLKLKSKYIKDFIINPYTLNVMEGKMGNRPKLIGTGNYFLNRIPIGQALRSTINR